MNLLAASTALASQARNFLRSLPSPALAQFLAAWPDAVPRATSRPPNLHPGLDHQPPVLRFLADFAADAQCASSPLAALLCRHAPTLEWRQTYSREEIGVEFLRNYAWTEFIGLKAPLRSERVACGVLLLGPDTHYPTHRHEAAEIYVPVSGKARWRQGDGDWREQPPGTVIHHANNEPHAMQTGPHPLLAVYVWHSSDLDQAARLSP